MDARTVPPSAGWLGKAHSPLVVWVDILPSELAAGSPAAFFCLKFPLKTVLCPRLASL